MINIPYKCRCMQDEAVVAVPARTEATGIVDWVEHVVAFAVGLDHRKRSPLCRETVMEYLKIPAPENAPILGGEPKLDS